jgi:hypothetical protein
MTVPTILALAALILAGVLRQKRKADRWKYEGELHL